MFVNPFPSFMEVETGRLDKEREVRPTIFVPAFPPDLEAARANLDAAARGETRTAAAAAADEHQHLEDDDGDGERELEVREWDNENLRSGVAGIAYAKWHPRNNLCQTAATVLA
jgi:hypothetical protein